jgi:hypothetical protein
VTIRRRSKIVIFEHPFRLAGIGRLLPPGGYKVVADSELIDGMFYPTYRRISTMMLVPKQSSQTSYQAVIIDPLDLASAMARDTAIRKQRCHSNSTLIANAKSSTRRNIRAT